MPKPIITVFGATGAQGGGLARALLGDRDRHFAVRAVTRKPDSAAARQLVEAGAQVVLADLDDGASVLRALEGAYGAFFVTSFWEHLSAEKELAQAHTLAAAAAQAGMRPCHLVDARRHARVLPAPTARACRCSQSRFNVPHFDAKGEAHRFFAQQRVPVTYLYTSGFWENLIHFGMGPQRQRRWRAGRSLSRPAMRAFPGSAPRTSASRPTKSSCGRRADLRLDRHRRRSPDRRRAGRAARAPRSANTWPTTRSAPDAFRALRFPGRRRTRQHVAVQARLRSRVSRAPRPQARARAASAACEFRHLAQGERKRASRWRRPPERTCARGVSIAAEAGARQAVSCCRRSARAEDARGLPQHLRDTGLYVAGRNEIRARRTAVLAAVPAVVRRRRQAPLDLAAAGHQHRRVARRTPGSFRAARSCGRSSRTAARSRRATSSALRRRQLAVRAPTCGTRTAPTRCSRRQRR